MGSVLSSVGSVPSYFCSPSPLPLQSPSPLPFASPSPEIKYDVFLSFRGEDTRNNFTSHLNKAFRGKGIDTFIDEDRLTRGDEISPSLLQAIEESQISVVIFSANYANSRWCLEELVKILECKKNHGQIIIPVFYQIDPSHVRHQTGSYAVAFTGHQRRFKEDLDKVQKWRCALTEAANLSGFDSLAIKPESVLVEKIVEDVLKRLNNMSSSDNKQLIGIESNITKIEEMLRMGDQTKNDVRKVGICGIGGIGKTTLAKAVFDKIYCQFPEGHFFIDSIREASEKQELNCLRDKLYSAILGDKNAYTYIYSKKRLHRKKLLIIFDDVTSFTQVDKLIGDLDCFRSGSRIIITSRNHQVLKNCGVNDIYKVEDLRFNDSLKLFCRHAFKQNRPKVDYKELSKGVVRQVGGVPLALKVLGSFLLGKRKEVWENSIKRLENILNKDVHEVLKISYDGLDPDQQRIFLDIACFYKGWDVNLVEAIMQVSLEIFIVGLSVLEDTCLIIILDNKLMMHDLLQAMGKTIVLQESIYPGKRTRLCNHDDICEVLTDATGTEKIMGISLDMSNARDIHLHHDAFDRMPNLRLLQFWRDSYNKIHVPQDLKFPWSKLRYLEWKRYPLKSLQPNSCLNNLVILNLSDSNVEQLWSDDQQFHHLKKIDLDGSRNLNRFPDLKAPKLEVLNLEKCTSLTKMPSSFTHLSRLMKLNISLCPNLASVPELPNNLTKLDLKGCSSLIEMPSSFQLLTKLKSLDLRHCLSLTSIPDCPGLISLEGNFVGLDLKDCSKLQRLSELPNNLVILNLEGCSSLIEISSIQRLTRLNSLRLRRCTSLTSMPDCSGLMSLHQLDITGCSKLERIPELPNNLGEINLEGCSSLIEISSIQHLTRLYSLFLRRCTSLTRMPDCSGLMSLRKLYITGCSKLERIPELPNNLVEINLEGCSSLIEISSSIQRLTWLRSLCLRRCTSLTSMPDCSGLMSLDQLDITGCSKLKRFPELPNNFVKINLEGCSSWIEISSIQCLTRLNSLRLCRCTSLTSMPDCSGLMSLHQLDITGCSNLERFSEIPNNFRHLCFCGCKSLLEIPSSFQHLRYLSHLTFIGCESPSIPDLTGLQALIYLSIRSCSKLQRLPELPNSIQNLFLEKIPIEELPPSFEHLCTLLKLKLIDCTRLKTLPIMSCVWKSLKTLCLQNYPTCALSISRDEDGVVGSLLPPIDFLHNLTILTLSGCGITEIPDRVCWLTSLQRLELDRNNFERIPESIVNLSNLSYLNISYCERLKVLPKLPWAHIDALNCTSLQEFSCPSFPNYSVPEVYIQCVWANFINCFKLDQNSIDSFVNHAQLEIQAKFPSNSKVCKREWDSPTLAICYPGSEIPKQFTFQCNRSFIDVKLPTDYNFLYFALCAVVSFPDQCDAHSIDPFWVYFECNVKSKKRGCRMCHTWFSQPHSLKYNMRSSHVVIGFGCNFLHQIRDDEFTIQFDGFYGLDKHGSCRKYCKVEKCGVSFDIRYTS